MGYTRIFLDEYIATLQKEALHSPGTASHRPETTVRWVSDSIMNEIRAQISGAKPFSTRDSRWSDADFEISRKLSCPKSAWPKCDCLRVGSSTWTSWLHSTLKPGMSALLFLDSLHKKPKKLQVVELDRLPSSTTTTNTTEICLWFSFNRSLGAFERGYNGAMRSTYKCILSIDKQIAY